MVPLVSVSVIRLERVVEVVVAFTEGQESEHWGILAAVRLAVGLRAPDVGC